MSKEFIDNEIDEAHQRIKEGDFEGAVEQLKNIKLRIHDESILMDIKEFENGHDKELIKTIDSSNKHHFDKHNEQMQQVVKYAKSYLRFYDKLRKENEIY